MQAQATTATPVGPKATLTLLFGVLALSACGGGGGDAGSPPAPPPPPTPTCVASPPPPAPAPGADPPQVTMTLNNGAGVTGDIVITLNPTAAPVTVANFLAYVNAGFYNCTIFHRHARDFVLQGGGYAAPVNVSATLPVLKPTNAPIALEDRNGLSNLRWTVAMARTNQPNSATSQFFINLRDNLFLDGTATQFGYAVFGTVTAGTNVVAAAQTAPCSVWPNFFGGGTDCLPVPNVVVMSARQTR